MRYKFFICCASFKTFAHIHACEHLHTCESEGKRLRQKTGYRYVIQVIACSYRSEQGTPIELVLNYN